MNRSAHIRPVVLAAAALAASLFAGSQAWSKTIEVDPTGDPSVDTIALQHAIDGASAGDTVVLKATNASRQFTPFNLDSTILPGRGTITINKALTITGEPYHSSLSDRTVINGGFATFFIDTLDPATGAVDGPVNFAMLESRGAVYAFLNYKACNGASIADLRILDALPAFPSDIYQYGFAGGISAENTGIWFPPLYSPDKIRGDFHISRCRVEFPRSMANLGSNCGIFFCECEANVTVSECQVYNTDVGIECVDSTGFVKIDACVLMTDQIALGAGILRLSKGIAANGISGPVDISNNRVFIDGTAYDDVPVEILGVVLLENAGPVTVGNNCIVASTNRRGLQSFCGKHFMVDGNVTCSGNQLCGGSSYGFLIFGSNNTFESNDLSGLTTTCMGAACAGNANVLKHNIFGPLNSGNYHLPVIGCGGNGNTVVHNDFRIAGVEGFNVSSSRVTRSGCILLDNGTSGNIVDASLEELPPSTGVQDDPLTQIVDLTCGSNTVNLEGVPAVWSHQYEQLLHMLSQNQEYRQRKAEIDAKLMEQLRMTETW